MIDTNEQLKELFAPFEHIDISKLRNHEITASKNRPIYWICEDNGGDLCCGKSTAMSQVDLVLSSQVKQIMFFRRREAGLLGN